MTTMPPDLAAFLGQTLGPASAGSKACQKGGQDAPKIQSSRPLPWRPSYEGEEPPF